MCEQCVKTWKDNLEGLRQWWPDLTDEDDRAYEILMNYTAFPMGSKEQVCRQIANLADVGPDVVYREFEDSWYALPGKTMEDWRRYAIWVMQGEPNPHMNG